MGTNYYLIRECCPHCNRGNDRIHIGKSSAGWCFSLRVHDDDGIMSLDDWETQWSQPNTRIVDEYGEHVSVEHMRSRILERAWSGPGGLKRHPIDNFCIGHGDGTYDLIQGEFS